MQPRRRRWSHGSPSPMLHSAHPSRLFLGRGRRHLLCHLEHHQGGRWQCPWLRLVQRTILSQISFPLWCPAPLGVLHPRDGKKRLRRSKQTVDQLEIPQTETLPAGVPTPPGCPTGAICRCLAPFIIVLGSSSLYDSSHYSAFLIKVQQASIGGEQRPCRRFER